MKYFFLLLLLSFLCLGELYAQVGINNPSPSQALDVGGKIKLGDDNQTPEAGTIRFNRTENTFEGFDGTEWTILNADPGSDGGGNMSLSSTYFVARKTFSGSSSDWEAEWNGATGGSSFVEVPAGRTLFITSIIIQSEGSTELLFLPTNSSGFPLLNSSLAVFDGIGGRTQQLHDANGQLIILPPGGKLFLNHLSGSARVFLRGFLQ